MAIDFEADSEARITEEQLKRVSQMIKIQTSMEDAILKLEENLEAENKKLNQIRQEIFPNLMKELGLMELKTSSGDKIELKKTVTTSIKVENRVKAYEWLRKHGFGSLIKTLVTARFGRGEEGKAQKLLKKLISEKFVAEFSENIASQTLSAFGREQIEKGKPLPEKLFSLFELTMTKVTRRKNEV
jgi:hypothetical protein